MSKPYVVLADPDPNYLSPLEDKLTEELYGQIELEIITEQTYLNEFFSTPKKIDTLIISSDFYSEVLNRHNITDIFVLTEDIDDNSTTNGITYIFKYSSTKEIFNHITYKNKQILNIQFSNKETQTIIVTSALGGSGKTTLAMAVCQNMMRNHKRTLFISADYVQAFAYYLQNKNALPNDFHKIFVGSDDKLYTKIKPYIRNEAFAYLPPFARNIQSYGLDSGIYKRIVEAAKASKEYDYIIIDTDSQIDESKAILFKNADKVIVNVMQDLYSTYKTEVFLRNMDCSNSDKYIFVCNKFRRDVSNEYIMSDIGRQYLITEYIDELPLYYQNTLDSFAEINGIKNLAYILS